MYKIFLIIFCFLAVIFVSASANTQAATSTEEIQLEDLSIEEPGILPGNPFYFFKEWGRNLRRLITRGPIKRAELELKIINEKVEELKKLEEIAPERTKAIEKAIENYNRNTKRLKNRLEALKETSQNPNIDKLLDKFIDRSLKHQQLFEKLKLKKERICIQVITPAKDLKTGECKEFPTPCDVLTGWIKIKSCQSGTEILP